jgi:hypothetical protein
MKKAIVDQVLLWIVIFISFITIFFFIVDYYSVVKLKDKSDLLVQYSVRMIALNKTTDEVVTGLNSIKSDYLNTISSEDLVCSIITNGEYKVKVTSWIDIDNIILEDVNMSASASSFNEASSSNISCTLNLSIN